MKKFIKKNWSNLIFLALIILLIIPQTRMSIQVGLQRLVSFSPSEINSEDRKQLKNYQWNLYSLEANKINLSQSEGRVVVINYWATWCPSCVAEMPELQALYNNYSDKVDFYFISSENKEKLQQFLKNKNYTIPVYIQTEKSPELLSTKSLPTTFLISKKGEIVIQKTGAANWNSDSAHKIIDKLLSQ